MRAYAPMPPGALIATLGSEPQVVTAACDLLLQQGELIGKVIVVHTVAPGTVIEQAVDRLRVEFNSPPYSDRVPLNLLPLLDEQNRPIADVESPTAARAIFYALYGVVRQAKMEGYHIHLSIAGGRKTMALFGMAAAQMLFDDRDCLWHLFSEGDFLESKRLHPQKGDLVHLIPIPVIRWSQVSPVWRGLGQVQDPFEAVTKIEQLRLSEIMEQARSFVLGSLTAAEERVVSLLVREGLGDMELASQLCLSPRTVEQHLRSAYAKAAAHWDLEDVGRGQLIALLNLYYITG